RTVASIWRYELQGQNAQEIARLAGELCDKVSMSLVDLNGVAEKITAAMSAHNEAVRRLSTGRGNALSIGARIRSLGVKPKRPMPSDRKSTRLNSSHVSISYAVFCLKKKKI